jgi:predicted amidohydrolase YtcJ
MRILFNGHVHTNQPGIPAVSALAIDHGRIVSAGSDAELLDQFGALAERTDLNGRTVWPGLIDAHLHLEYYSLSLAQVNCETATRSECLKRLAERAASTPAGKWVRGYGFNQNLWPEGYGSRADLDEIATHNPVYLISKSVHAGWANTEALRLAGIDALTPDPQNGKIVRDDAGNPTGILLESAMQMVEMVIPPSSVDDLAQAIRDAQQILWSHGITGVHDYDRALTFSALQELDKRSELRLRVVKSIPLELLPQAVALGLRSGFGSQFLRIGSVKLFADGALGPHTAAMLQPYEGDPDNTGILFLDNEQIYEYGIQAASGGISMAIHAIGDRANHEVLQAYSQLRAYESQHGLPRLRHRIEHVQCLHPQDSHRLAELDVIASVQPIHATSDMYMADQFWGDRSAGAYAYRTLIDQETRVAFGSDAPVESPNPWLGLHAAVTRQRPDASPDPQGWYPQQRLSLQEALSGFTTGPAYAAGLEDRQGCLVPGFYADLIVLDQDPFTLSPQDLHAINPVATMVGGDWVWQRE